MTRVRRWVVSLIAVGFVAGCSAKPAAPPPTPARSSMEGVKEGSNSRTDTERW